HIKRFMQVAYDDFAARRGAMDLYSALSGKEIAARRELPYWTIIKMLHCKWLTGVRYRTTSTSRYFAII
ncbi:MAG: hypothetical protein V3S24_19160, partial [Candidatus Tectomicrobia bacterium]